MSAWDTTADGRRMANQHRVVEGMIEALLPELEDLKHQLALSYSALMSIGERREHLAERARVAYLMDYLEEFRVIPAEAYDLVAEANKMLAAMGPGGKEGKNG